MKISEVANKISELTRSKDWRISFVPFVMGCVYLWGFQFDLSFSGHHVLVMLLSLVTTIGFAALGYFINELFDQDFDAKAGKLNKLSFIPKYQVLLLAIGILLVTFLPWLYLPKNSVTYYLIAAEVGCFLLYSLPLIRLKDTVFGAGVIDALYAYLIPGLLSYHTFSLLAIDVHVHPTLFFVSIFFIGYRNIFIHQVNDIIGDQRAGIITLPQWFGVARSHLFLQLLFIIEMSLVVCFSIQLALFNELHFIWILVVFSYWWYRKNEIRSVFSKHTYTAIDENKHFPDLLYQLWFPLVHLLLFVTVDWRWILVVPFHYFFLLKYRIIYKAWHFIWVKNLRPAISFIVNYCIYGLFRMFGVNLKEKNLSALGYIKSLFK